VGGMVGGNTMAVIAPCFGERQEVMIFLKLNNPKRKMYCAIVNKK
jgi:hypothetical protein